MTTTDEILKAFDKFDPEYLLTKSSEAYIYFERGYLSGAKARDAEIEELRGILKLIEHRTTMIKDLEAK
jgi:hypothetical protein